MTHLRQWSREVLGDVIGGFREDRCVLLAGSLAYFALISLAPMLIIALRVTALFLEPGAGREELLQQVGQIVGPDGVETVASMIESARLAERSTIMTTAGFAVLVFAGTTLFAKLAEALNIVFDVERQVRKGAVLQTLRRRFLSLLVVIAIGVLLLLSVIVDTGIVTFFRIIERFLQQRLAFLLAGLNYLISTAISAVLFAAVLKVMPERPVLWRSALAGGLMTAVIFSAAKLGFGLVLGNQSVASAYGAAGAVVVVLLWVFLTAVAILVGAELAAVLQRRGWTDPH